MSFISANGSEYPLNYYCNKAPETIPDQRNMYSYRNSDKFKTGVYDSYKDIAGGYISYYSKKRPIEEIFMKPNYVNNQVVLANLYRDPMGSLKPEYNICQTKNNLRGHLSFLQDTTEWREQLMAKQMRKHNQNHYESKWNIS